LWEALFRAANLLAVVGWAVLLLAPARAGTVRTAGVGLLAALYVAAVAGLVSGALDPVRDGPPPDLADYSVAGLRRLFASDGGVAVGWVHYLALDLMAGCWIAGEAAARGWHRVAAAPVLLLTFLAGPAGVLLWLVLRTRRVTTR